ncbi:hypothetical protein [Paracoccus sp. PAMC 22219]|uniref:hypothetical protein n=1 Tax=Paracoccus sp. PAMC 22219 TaxID=1569209 RepID=UPI0012DFEE66|nr:hypothetical protein [Paracoccus sp. PAMC 22219]
MATQILMPLHTYPNGNSSNIAAQVGTVARHLGAAVHGLVLERHLPTPTHLVADR